MGAGAKIIEGLKEAVRGDFARVTIEGQTWVRLNGDQVITRRDPTIAMCEAGLQKMLYEDTKIRMANAYRAMIAANN